ncbi:MAG: flagellar assembly peptidoglycan hydrolase FlgJ [Proteobacteria bacterium]|nr:MAG: flagellar assembly peptidoglycan hydrolase FlgJ [Pseudomonadota bacterium]
MNIENNPYQQAGIYTELQGLNDIKVQAREDKSAALKQVARQFESMFLTMMMKSMREANKVFEENNFLHSNESAFYQDMFDNQLSLSLSQGKGIGLAESLYRQMARQIDGVEPDSATGSVNRHAIQDYPRSIPAMKAVRMVDAMVEIDRVLEEKNAEQEKANRSTVLSGSPVSNPLTQDQWEQAIASMTSRIQDQTRASRPLAGPEPEIEPTDRTSGAGNTELASDPAVPRVFDSPEQFVTALFPIAQKIESETGMNARFMLAQSALETGWGKHMIEGEGEGEGNQASFNLFGIKADQRWQGDRVTIVTTEFRDQVPIREKASFRAYDSYEDSFRDYVTFLKENPRYQDATRLFTRPEELARELQQAGYATDPQYSEKIKRIFNSELLQSALASGSGY